MYRTNAQGHIVQVVPGEQGLEQEAVSTMATTQVGEGEGEEVPTLDPEEVLEERILLAQERRELLVRKGGIISLQARLAEIDLENAEMEEEFSRSIEAIETKRQLGIDKRRAANRAAAFVNLGQTQQLSPENLSQSQQTGAVSNYQH